MSVDATTGAGVQTQGRGRQPGGRQEAQGTQLRGGAPGLDETSSQLAAAPPGPPWEQIPLSRPQRFPCERGVKQLASLS